MNQYKPIERDFNGHKPDGIQINDNKQWVVYTGIGLIIGHFVFGPILAFLGALWLIFGAICCGPAIGVIVANHHHFNAVAGVLLALGLFIWIRYSWKAFKKIVYTFDKHTHFRWGPGYQGPPNPLRQPGGHDKGQEWVAFEPAPERAARIKAARAGNSRQTNLFGKP